MEKKESQSNFQNAGSVSTQEDGNKSIIDELEEIKKFIEDSIEKQSDRKKINLESIKLVTKKLKYYNQHCMSTHIKNVCGTECLNILVLCSDKKVFGNNEPRLVEEYLNILNRIIKKINKHFDNAKIMDRLVNGISSTHFDDELKNALMKNAEEIKRILFKDKILEDESSNLDFDDPEVKAALMKHLEEIARIIVVDIDLSNNSKNTKPTGFSH